jgi:Xaa-Pro dipeptidase
MPTEVLADELNLRQARRCRALAEMEAADIDVLVLGKEANARYVTGAPRLWTAGTRPFGPGCVMVRATGGIHLVSTWDEGIPEEIPHEHLFGITWNPGNLLAWLRGIEGVQDARRVGTDSLTPRFAQLLPKVFPSADLVDAEPALQAARRVKTAEEVDLIRDSLTVAEKALAAAVGEVCAGVSERHLTAIFMEAMAHNGVTTPATQRVARVSPRSGRASEPGVVYLHDDDLVIFDAGVMASGYGSEVGRTWPVSSAAIDRSTEDLYARADHLWSSLLEACRPGLACSRLLAAYEETGHPLPPFPIAAGVGLGFDVPVVTGQLARTAAQEYLEPGMVLSVTARVAGVGREVVRKDVVLITSGEPEVLTSSPFWAPEPS